MYSVQQPDEKNFTLSQNVCQLYQVLQSIHRQPGIREWCSFESEAMCPVPYWNGQRWLIYSLLAKPMPSKSSHLRWGRPWGLVVWGWPSLNVEASLSQSKLNESMDWETETPSIHLDREEYVRCLQGACEALEKVLQGSSHNLGSEMKNWYTTLLPPSFLSIYKQFIPGGHESLSFVSDQTLTPSDLSKESVALDLSVATDEPLNDLSLPLETWMKRSQTLVLESQDQYLIEAQQAFQEQLERPGFRLSFIGEFSRGKSHLINRLLGQDLLPVGVLSTTATLVQIMPDLENSLLLENADGLPEKRPLVAESWHDLVAMNEYGVEQKVLSKVRVQVNDPWLESLNMEWVDTPGAGDLGDERAALVTDTLSQSDAVVMVVSAHLPFSLTEQGFLETEVMGKHISQIVVLVSHLDEHPMTQRVEIFNSVRDRIHALNADLCVLPSHSLSVQTSDEMALAAIRQQIEGMTHQSDRQRWRSHQMARRLQDLLFQLQDSIAQQKNLLRLTLEEKEQQYQTLKKGLCQRREQWNRLELEIEARRQQHQVKFRGHLFEIRDSFLEQLQYELSRVPDPKTWWERDLPFLLRREFSRYQKQFEGMVTRHFANDYEWLQLAIQDQFKSRLQLADEGSAPSMAEITSELGEMKLVSSQRYRILTRIGSGVAMLGGYLLGGPIGIVASTGIWLLGEQLLNQSVEQQRHRLSSQLSLCLEKSYEEYWACVSVRWRSLYQKMVDACRQEQESWYERQMALIQQPDLSGDQDHLQGLEVKVSNLQADLNDQFHA